MRHREPTPRTTWLLKAPDGAISTHWCEEHETFHLMVVDAATYDRFRQGRAVKQEREERETRHENRVKRKKTS